MDPSLKRRRAPKNIKNRLEVVESPGTTQLGDSVTLT